MMDDDYMNIILMGLIRRFNRKTIKNIS